MYFAITDSKVLSSLILSLSLDRDLYLIESNLTVAKWTSMCRICEFRMEPSINALGMEEMMTEGDLSHRCSFLEFLEADHTLCLLELVDAFIIRALSDQCDQSIDSLLLVLHPSPYLQPHLCLVVLDLLLQLSLPYAHPDNGPDADAYEREHKDEED